MFLDNSSTLDLKVAINSPVKIAYGKRGTVNEVISDPT